MNIFAKVSPKGRMRPASKPGRRCPYCLRVVNPLSLYVNMPDRAFDRVCYRCIGGK